MTRTASRSRLAGGKLSGKTFELLGDEISVPAAAFALICAGLALRAPIWPLHGWFTHVAEEAPSSVFVAMAAVTVPVATYIFMRLCYSLFPDVTAVAARAIVVVGILNLLIGGVCALAQKRLNLLLAYICLSEVGFLLIGVGSINAAGVVGAVYQQLVLGLGLAGFGLFAGLISERTGSTEFLTGKGEPAYGGIAQQAPGGGRGGGRGGGFAARVPGLWRLRGHALLTIGSYSVHPITVILTGGALLLATYYLFTMYRCVFLGKAQGDAAFADLGLRERAYLVPVVAGLLAFGLYPKPLLDLVQTDGAHPAFDGEMT